MRDPQKGPPPKQAHHSVNPHLMSTLRMPYAKHIVASKYCIDTRHGHTIVYQTRVVQVCPNVMVQFKHHDTKNSKSSSGMGCACAPAEGSILASAACRLEPGSCWGTETKLPQKETVLFTMYTFCGSFV